MCKKGSIFVMTNPCHMNYYDTPQHFQSFLYYCESDAYKNADEATLLR